MPCTRTTAIPRSAGSERTACVSRVYSFTERHSRTAVVYSTCLFCNGPLGANSVIEQFPIGRRLAFDGAKGRLWVVCRQCERWNLTPLEERWEAIEECERRFRDTRLRFSTDQIGLARMREGLELVRIGQPLRPELAAWRYGDQFGRRRRRAYLRIGLGVGLAGAVAVGGATVGAGIGGAWWALYQTSRRIALGGPRDVVATVRASDGDRLLVRRSDLDQSLLHLGPSGEPRLQLRHKGGTRLLDGGDAIRALGPVLVPANRFGASRSQLEQAVRDIERVGTADAYVAHAAGLAERRVSIGAREDARRLGALHLAPEQRLALEMAVHEESERRSLEGELGVLAQAWKAAEEIAAIADDMFLPPRVAELLERYRARGR